MTWKPIDTCPRTPNGEVEDPTSSIDYLLTIDLGSSFKCVEVGFYCFEEKAWIGCDGRKMDATHWMNLPEPAL